MNVYMGWDPREQVAYDVAEHSIRRHGPSATVRPLKLADLPMLKRPIERRGAQLWCPISQAPMATEFAVSRFCVPFLQRKGWALFCDCDVLAFDDVNRVVESADKRFAVMVVKHSYQPTETIKMDGQIQTTYSRKNWSSVILWNCEHPAHQRLTLMELNTWPGRDLHAFKWLEDSEIGELPRGWNYLVGVSQALPALMLHIAHYTLGTPNMPGYERCELAEDWFKELARMETLHGSRAIAS